MRTTYIDLDLLDNITVIPRVETNNKWYEEILPSHKTFLGFKFGKTEGYSAGWGYNRLSTEELLRYYPNYKVDEENKVVYEKSMVILTLTNGRSFNQYFDTDEDAEEYAFEINVESGKNLFAINHN